MAEKKVRQTDGQTDRQTDKQTDRQTRHSHRHSPRRAYGSSHVTIKAKVILAKEKFLNILPINLENFVVLIRSLYLKNGLRYRQSYYCDLSGSSKVKGNGAK